MKGRRSEEVVSARREGRKKKEKDNVETRRTLRSAEADVAEAWLKPRSYMKGRAVTKQLKGAELAKS
jgi:hypothetical protein